jgi:hypothetical protein
LKRNDWTLVSPPIGSGIAFANGPIAIRRGAVDVALSTPAPCCQLNWTDHAEAAGIALVYPRVGRARARGTASIGEFATVAPQPQPWEQMAVNLNWDQLFRFAFGKLPR